MRTHIITLQSYLAWTQFVCNKICTFFLLFICDFWLMKKMEESKSHIFDHMCRIYSGIFAKRSIPILGPVICIAIFAKFIQLFPQGLLKFGLLTIFLHEFCMVFQKVSKYLAEIWQWATSYTRGCSSNIEVYVRGDSMNGTPTVSWQRLCAIDRVKLKVTKSSVKSQGNPHTAKFDRKLAILKPVQFRGMGISLTFDT